MLSVIQATACEHATTPEDPRWGAERCGHCAMLVSERRSAAQTLYDGRRVYFDDIGCLVLWQDKRSLSGKAWVYLDGAWTDALTVRFRGEQQTPMDFGFVPASNGGAAWGDVQRSVRAKVRAP